MTDYDRKTDVLAKKYEVPVDKIYSIASEGKIVIRVLTSAFVVYGQVLHLPNESDVAFDILDEFESNGGVEIDELNLFHVDSLTVESSVFKKIIAGEINPKLLFNMEHVDGQRYLLFKVLNTDGEEIRFDECVLILNDNEIAKLEQFLSPRNDIESNTSSFLNANCEINKDVGKSKYNKRKLEFEQFISEEKISLEGKISNDIHELVKKWSETRNLYPRLWSIQSETFRTEFYGKYANEKGIQLNKGRPQGD